MRDDAAKEVSLHSGKVMGDTDESAGAKRMRAEDYVPAPCVSCAPHWNSFSGGDVHPTEDRYFTVREYMRLQSFPDVFKLYGSLSEMYKLVGNAVPALLAYRVGLACKAALLGE